MDVNAVPATHMAIAAAAQPLQAVLETQVAMLREQAESQQQIVRMLAESGLGQRIDINA